jgi:16S rRNA (guanine527-N7)-methyltransferase
VDGAGELRLRLSQGLERLGLRLSPDAQEALLAYIALLGRWNRVYNLTAVRDPREMVTRHLLDSLAAAPFIKGPRVIDVGTGAGLPGIPLALAFPQWSFVLLDSHAKKTRFVTQASAELRLANVSVVNTRVEAYRPGLTFDTVICRAFGSLTEIIAMTRHLYGREGRLVAMKGELWPEEIAQVPADFRVRNVTAIQVPDLEARRHLVCIEPLMKEEFA